MILDHSKTDRTTGNTDVLTAVENLIVDPISSRPLWPTFVEQFR